MIWIHTVILQAQIQEFLSGGGVGWGMARRPKKQSGQRFFVVFFSRQLILQFTEVVKWYYCRENYTFPRIQRGSYIFQVGGVPTFSREGGGDVQMLSSIETHITCDFPGGVRTPCPLDQHMYCNYMLTTDLLMLILSIKIGDELSSQSFEPDKC